MPDAKKALEWLNRATKDTRVALAVTFLIVIPAGMKTWDAMSQAGVPLPRWEWKSDADKRARAVDLKFTEFKRAMDIQAKENRSGIAGNKCLLLRNLRGQKRQEIRDLERDIKATQAKGQPSGSLTRQLDDANAELSDLNLQYRREC